MPHAHVWQFARYLDMLGSMKLTNKQTDQVLSTVSRTGGISYHVPSGTQLVSGYAVSPYPHAERIVRDGTLTATDLAAYVAAHADLLCQPNHCLGIWTNDGSDTDTDTTGIYLDVSIIVPDADTAHRVAIEHGQLAFFHLDTSTTTYLSI